jgi:hypothetical protein
MTDTIDYISYMHIIYIYIYQYIYIYIYLAQCIAFWVFEQGSVIIAL